MKPVFADTSYYLALLGEKDDYHDAALGWSENLLGRIIVTEYVLVELGNGLSRSKHRHRYAPFVEHVLADPDTLLFPVCRRRRDASRTARPSSPAGTAAENGPCAGSWRPPK